MLRIATEEWMNIFIKIRKKNDCLFLADVSTEPPYKPIQIDKEKLIADIMQVYAQQLLYSGDERAARVKEQICVVVNDVMDGYYRLFETHGKDTFLDDYSKKVDEQMLQYGDDNCRIRERRQRAPSLFRRLVNRRKAHRRAFLSSMEIDALMGGNNDK
jgi:hypothetical protein